MKFNNDIVTSVIRSANERTIDLCRNLVEAQIPKQQISVIREVPFSKALKQSFEIGIDRDLPWTLIIDADVLLREGAVFSLLQIADQTDSHVFEIQGRILDRFTGGPRSGGAKLYKTSLLSKALSCIPPDETSERPEEYTILQMSAKGFPRLEVEVVFGLHDYEQWYRDIYRKAFFHSHKFADRISCWESMWKRLSDKNLDFQVALLGLKAGRDFHGKVSSDIRQFSVADINRVLHKYGLSEKPEISLNDISAKQIGDVIDTFVPSREYWKWKLEKSDGLHDNPSLHARLHRIKAKTGWIKLGPYFLGESMKRIGVGLQKWAAQ